MLPDALKIAETAFFFDFDGTLSPIVDDPAEARPVPTAVDVLGRLQREAGGAVAIISGRSIEQLDVFLSPLRLPAAGVHGLQIRHADGSAISHVAETDALERVHKELLAFAGRHQGLLVEMKPGSVTLHYRKRPDLERQAADFTDELSTRFATLERLEGKMVVELKQPGRTKLSALKDLLQQAPFARRGLLYAGDDAPDEEVFAFVEERNGVAIKVGSGPTCARQRIADPAALAHWVASILP